MLSVAFGAFLGVNARYIIYKKLETTNLSKNYIILIINTLSSFLLGFLFSFQEQISFLSYSNQLGLFLSVGLLGSLSTFSTFIYHLYELLIQVKFVKALKLFTISIASALLAFAIGLVLGLG